MYIGLHVKYILYLPDLMKLEFCGQVFEKNIQISNSMTVRPVGAELFQAGGRTGRQA